MSIGDSIVSICNIGLIELGQDIVVNVLPTPDNSTPAILCAQRYDQVRRATLRAYPWRCAWTLAQIAASTTAPPFMYGQAYPFPPDCLRVVGIADDTEWSEEAWDVAGNQILTDIAAPIDLVYVRDLQDPVAMDPLLVECIGLGVGAAIAVKLTGSIDKRDDLLKIYSAKLSTARLADSQQNSVKELDIDELLRARR